MGDRAVIGFRDNLETPPLFLYVHWMGGEPNEVLAAALEAARGRWDDYSYASRICISQVIGDKWNSETGFGLYVGGTSHEVNYAEVLIVDWSRAVVMVCNSYNSEEVSAEIPLTKFVAGSFYSEARSV